jgi:hypothetical protein
VGGVFEFFFLAPFICSIAVDGGRLAGGSVGQSLGSSTGGGDFGGKCLWGLILPNRKVIGLVEAFETGAVAGDLVSDTVIHGGDEDGPDGVNSSR